MIVGHIDPDEAYVDHVYIDKPPESIKAQIKSIVINSSSLKNNENQSDLAHEEHKKVVVSVTGNMFESKKEKKSRHRRQRRQRKAFEKKQAKLNPLRANLASNNQMLDKSTAALLKNNRSS